MPAPSTTPRASARAVPRAALPALLLVGGLFAALVAASPSRVIGDGREYLDLARAIGAGGGQAFSTAWHFWMYPALAAPLVRAGDLAGLSQTAGFTVLNAALLLLALWVVARELSVLAAVFLVVGPIIWWIDKPHTEVFTFALLSIGLAKRGSAWSPVAVGLAATQNPPIGILLPLLLADWWARRRRTRAASVVDGAGRGASRRQMAAGFAAGFALVGLPAVYYELTRGVVNPLIATGQAQIPTLREALVVVGDTNLGLIIGYPLFPLFVGLIGTVLVVRLGPRTLLREAWLPMAAGATFLWSFAQVTNFNHGATPGMSRYGLWLLPLGIPLLRLVAGPDRPAESVFCRRCLQALCVASVAWSLVGFRPSLPEGAGTPSTVARFLWHQFPSLDQPLPEVFAERTSGRETRALPVAEPGCAKVLLLGDGAEGGMWPAPCPPAVVPAECRRAGRLCYADRTPDGYRFVPVAPRQYHAFELRNDTWPVAAEGSAGTLLGDRGWAEAAVVRAGGNGVMLRGAHSLRRAHALQAPDRLFVYAVQPRQGATLDLRLPFPMRGRVVDLRTGQLLYEVDLAGGRGVQSLPLPLGPDLVGFVATRDGR